MGKNTKSRSKRGKKRIVVSDKVSFQINQTMAKNVLDAIRKTHCNQCGHCHLTPYPVLQENKLPFDIIECDLNKYYYRSMMQFATNNKNEEEQKRIVEEKRNDHQSRGV